MPYTSDLTRLLTPGARYVDDESTTYVVERHHVGEVVLPTGEVVGCDPLSLYGTQPPFTATVPPGRYPLVAWVAVMYSDGAERDRRVAAVQLAVRPEPPTRWEMALVAGQDPGELGDTEYFGFGVDACTATLADRAAVDALAGWDFDRVHELLIEPRLDGGGPVAGTATVVVEADTGANVVTVESGWGDGSYPTFVGRTPDGSVASYVVDFAVVLGARPVDGS